MENLNQDILNYCIEHSTNPSTLAKALQNKTAETSSASHMLIGELEASLLQFLIKLGRVKNILEFGTFTGYSALIMAEALPQDGKIFTVDINPHTTKMAKEFWDKSPHGKKINQILKPGKDALKELEGLGPFDLIFIDADKNGYPNYLKWGIENLSEHGMIVTDNTLWSGKILTPGLDPQTESIRTHNEIAKNLNDFTKTLLPIRDGIFLITKN